MFCQGFQYHQLPKTFTKFFNRCTELISKFGSTCRKLIKNGISHPKFYGNIVLKARKSLCDPCKLIEPLNKLISKDYRTNIVIRSLNIVHIGTNIDIVISKLKHN